MCAPYIQTSSFSTRQNESLIWALPIRIDFTSVPRSCIPASKRSPTAKSRNALEFLTSVRRGASFFCAAMGGVGCEACVRPSPSAPRGRRPRSVLASLEADLFLYDLAKRNILRRKLFQRLDQGTVAA